MTNYFSTIAQIQETTWTDETALEVADACRSQFFFQSRPTDKLVLFFHGFTAVPEQFAAISTALFDQGYNVLVPRLPGHGLPGEWNADQPPPLPKSASTYQEFALSWLETAHHLSRNIVVGGLSSGATLAAWLALEHPHTIDRALLFAPYLTNSNGLVNWVIETFNFYFKWRVAPGAISFGYQGFYMPALRVFLELGKEVLQRTHTTPMVPSLILSSAADQTTPSSDYQELFQSISQFHPETWNVRLDRALQIPHNMMTKAEGNRHADLVIEIAKTYLENPLPWQDAEPLIQRTIQQCTAMSRF